MPSTIHPAISSTSFNLDHYACDQCGNASQENEVHFYYLYEREKTDLAVLLTRSFHFRYFSFTYLS